MLKYNNKNNIEIVDNSSLSQGQIKIKPGSRRNKKHTFTSIHAAPQVVPRIHVILG